MQVLFEIAFIKVLKFVFGFIFVFKQQLKQQKCTYLLVVCRLSNCNVLLIAPLVCEYHLLLECERLCFNSMLV